MSQLKMNRKERETARAVLEFAMSEIGYTDLSAESLEIAAQHVAIARAMRSAVDTGRLDLDCRDGETFRLLVAYVREDAARVDRPAYVRRVLAGCDSLLRWSVGAHTVVA